MIRTKISKEKVVALIGDGKSLLKTYLGRPNCWYGDRGKYLFGPKGFKRRLTKALEMENAVIEYMKDDDESIISFENDRKHIWFCFENPKKKRKSN